MDSNENTNGISKNTEIPVPKDSIKVDRHMTFETSHQVKKFLKEELKSFLTFSVKNEGPSFFGDYYDNHWSASPNLPKGYSAFMSGRMIISRNAVRDIYWHVTDENDETCPLLENEMNRLDKIISKMLFFNLSVSRKKRNNI